jgi:hypothetical protein
MHKWPLSPHHPGIIIRSLASETQRTCTTGGGLFVLTLAWPFSGLFAFHSLNSQNKGERSESCERVGCSQPERAAFEHSFLLIIRCLCSVLVRHCSPLSVRRILYYIPVFLPDDPETPSLPRTRLATTATTSRSATQSTHHITVFTFSSIEHPYN